MPARVSLTFPKAYNSGAEYGMENYSIPHLWDVTVYAEGEEIRFLLHTGFNPTVTLTVNDLKAILQLAENREQAVEP